MCSVWQSLKDDFRCGSCRHVLRVRGWDRTSYTLLVSFLSSDLVLLNPRSVWVCTPSATPTTSSFSPFVQPLSCLPAREPSRIKSKGSRGLLLRGVGVYAPGTQENTVLSSDEPGATLDWPYSDLRRGLDEEISLRGVNTHVECGGEDTSGLPETRVPWGLSFLPGAWTRDLLNPSISVAPNTQ